MSELEALKRTCKNPKCGKTFTYNYKKHRAFCSNKCRLRYYYRSNTTPEVRTCVYCGKMFTPKRPNHIICERQCGIVYRYHNVYSKVAQRAKKNTTRYFRRKTEGKAILLRATSEKLAEIGLTIAYVRKLTK